MGFVAGFYGFNLHVANAQSGVYADLRIKTARHPEEPVEFLHARTIAYAHCYREGQIFSEGWYKPKEPTIWQRSLTGDLDLWVEVGLPDEEKLHRALRRHGGAELRIYFLNQAEVRRFCSYLRGSTTNWAAKIRFFLLDDALLAALSLLERSNSNWEMTFVDETLYLTVDGEQLEGSLLPVDIWKEYQSSLAAE